MQPYIDIQGAPMGSELWSLLGSPAACTSLRNIQKCKQEPPGTNPAMFGPLPVRSAESGPKVLCRGIRCSINGGIFRGSPMLFWIIFFDWFWCCRNYLQGLHQPFSLWIVQQHDSTYELLTAGIICNNYSDSVSKAYPVWNSQILHPEARLNNKPWKAWIACYLCIFLVLLRQIHSVVGGTNP